MSGKNVAGDWFIRPGQTSDAKAISELVQHVAHSHVAPSLGEGGLQRMLETMQETNFTERLKASWPCLVAVDHAAPEKILGVAMARLPSHLYALFVRADRQRSGIGVALLAQLSQQQANSGSPLKTVNASLATPDFYKRFGFAKRGAVKDVHGVRFQPMVRCASVQIRLVGREEDLLDAWRERFSGEPRVDIIAGDITSVPCDAIVSPANSFGFMDGGLDDALSRRFGWDLQEALQQEIAELPEGELLVGQTLALPTGDEQVPWLVSAPTMRVPMSYQIATSVHAYLAMKAALLAVTSHPSIFTVAVPGMCTGVGRMPAKTAALQMHAAFREVMQGPRAPFADFGEAQRHQADLNPDGMIWDD